MGTAYLTYGVKLVLFAVIAFCGIMVGVQIRKAKDKKEIKEVNEAKGKGSNE